jgi:AraC-like DNA-binding protein
MAEPAKVPAHVIFSQAVSGPPGAGQLEQLRRHGAWRNLHPSDPAQSWYVGLLAEEPIEGFPSYRCEGRWRPGERRCLCQITLEGEGLVTTGSGTTRLPAGSAFLCDVGDPEVTYRLPEHAPRPWRFLYLTFTGAAAEELVRGLIAGRGHCFRIPVGHPAIARLLRFERHRATYQVLSAIEGSRLVLELLLALASGLQAGAGGHLVAQAMSVIAARDPGQWSVATIADQLAVTREHLSREFRRHFAVDLRTFLGRERVAIAVRLLGETALSCKEIARRCGFRSSAALTRSFVLEMGESPRAYRRGRGPAAGSAQALQGQPERSIRR